MDDQGVLEKLLQHPLLLHSEVAEGGRECLEQLEKLVASGTVGSRTLKAGTPDSTVYWRKKDKVSNNSPKQKRRHPRFVSPLVSSGTDSASKRPRLTPSRHSAPTPHDVEEEAAMHQLREEKKSLERKLMNEEEKLRKLKLVKLYRSKNDLGKLNILIDKWRLVSQDAAEALLCSSSREPRPTMAEMLSYVHIDTSLIKYSTEQESFY